MAACHTHAYNFVLFMYIVYRFAVRTVHAHKPMRSKQRRTYFAKTFVRKLDLCCLYSIQTWAVNLLRRSTDHISHSSLSLYLLPNESQVSFTLYPPRRWIWKS